MSRASGTSLRLAGKLAIARAAMKLARAWDLPFRERAYRTWYDAISELSELLFSDFRCMNYGYASVAEVPGAESDDPERFQLGLYDFLAALTPLRGKRVLEVGSGRGGGAAHVLHAHGASHVTGLDLSERAVEASRTCFDDAGLRFLSGNAEALPFEDASFDVVFNVESSHGYPNVDAFLEEAHRVLTDDGMLLFADFRHAEEAAATEALVASSRFKIEHQMDITQNVLAALEADDARKRELIDGSSAVPDLIRGSIHHFAGCIGSPMYEDFRCGRRMYFAYALRAS
ncbi:MAG: class I SAM-dependent methyltransferase [bacterium]|nr:class I SAM-dependent methyltransferase [bacterium]MCP5070113.1 class I SAM-dependent methyltransferase [bacterium]